MMTPNRFYIAAGMVLSLVAGGTAAYAHRPLAGKFDLTTSVELTGVVTAVDWRNPQGHIFINVTTGNKVENWAIEIESPSLLERDGWTRDTVRPGDRLTVKGPRARDNSRQVWGGDNLRFAHNGMEVFPARPAISRTPLSPRPTPRWPDGQPALGALPGMADGFWGNPSKTALVEDGVEVRMDADGLLADINDAPKVAPMQPWALALYRHRQQRFLRDDPTFLNCKPPGGVRQYQSPLGIQFIEDRQRNRIFVLMGSGNRNYRIIYMGANRQAGLVSGDDDNPLYFGRSSGKWEGDTLVVSTIGFNEDFWFTRGGLPHTDLLRLTERFTRTNHETLRYQVEIDDPGAYTRKWSASWTLTWNGGGSLPSHFCQNNRQ